VQYSRIFHIDIACIDHDQLLELVDEWASDPNPSGGRVRTLSYVNAHCLNLASQDPDYLESLHTFDLIYPDGIGAVWASRWLGGCRLVKLTGADWIYSLCKLAEEKNWGIYLLAGKRGVAKTAQENLADRFPNLRILGARDGFFTEGDETSILSDLERCQPEILFVGMGVPLQEAWINKNKSMLSVRICWAVGALFDYVAGIEPRAPAWMRRYSLEWLWRLSVNPSGKWRRYLLGNPIYIMRLVLYKFLARK
jgi:N-acetylglucosaminyldiphosphoundecaprenol N-acetyl-beta-D-mannosaminyltransferase